MATITFNKNNQTLEVPESSNLMEVLNEAGIPVASSCGGNGVCNKCIIQILEGKENLSPESDLEIDMREIHDIPKGYRMSCQTQVLGDIKIDADYW